MEQLQAKVIHLEQTIIDINNTLGQFKGLMFGVIEELKVLRGGGKSPAFPRNASASMQEGHRYATQAMTPSSERQRPRAPAPAPAPATAPAPLPRGPSAGSFGVAAGSSLSGLPSFDWGEVMSEGVDIDGALDTLVGADSASSIKVRSDSPHLCFFLSRQMFFPCSM